jgi:DNA helicase HerA-like ATPase
MSEPLLIAKNSKAECCLLPALANRHGLITGATGTGKTITLQTTGRTVQQNRRAGFYGRCKRRSDGHQSGWKYQRETGNGFERTAHWIRLNRFACPTTLWDVFGEQGHPVRATVSDMGPLLLARMLGLNDTQEGVLQLVFKIADDNGLLLLDMKDLRTMLQHVGDTAKNFTTAYGNISAASVGAIQRGLLQIEEQGGDRFFGEPMLDIADFMQTDSGKGVINILAADKLMNNPRVVRYVFIVDAIGII